MGSISDIKSLVPFLPIPSVEGDEVDDGSPVGSPKPGQKRKVEWDTKLHLRVIRSSDRIFADFDISNTVKLRRFMKSVDAVDRDKWRVEPKYHNISLIPEEVKEIRKMPKKENGDFSFEDISNTRLQKTLKRLISKQIHVFSNNSQDFRAKIDEYIVQIQAELFRRKTSQPYEIEILD